MGFANPWALIGLLLILLIGRWAGWRWPKRSSETITEAPPNRRLRLLTWLRGTVVVLLVFAWADFSVDVPTKNRRMVMLFDVSDSIARNQVERSRKAALGLLEQLNPHDRIALLAFAGRTRLVSTLTGPNEAKAILESADLTVEPSNTTNIDSALQAGGEVLKEPQGNRSIILFTDGRNTTGIEDLGKVKNTVAPIYPVPIGRSNSDVVTEELVLPQGLRAGETGNIHWMPWSNRARKVTLFLKSQGKVLAQQNVNLPMNDSHHSITVPPLEPGIYPITFEVQDTITGELLPSAASGGVLPVEGPAKILVVSDNKTVSPLTQVLTTQGFAVIGEQPQRLPETPGGLSLFSGVVFDNVSANSLTEKQLLELQDYVAGGGGFFVVGGDASLGRGDYFQTVLEEMLPVNTDARQRLRFSRANVLFIIDRSGSMGETIGDVPKQLAAMKGVITAIDGLNPQDEVAILAFSSRPSWVIPFTPVAERKKIEKAIENMERGGGTEMSTALEEATRGFAGRGPVRRHVVLLSDGITDFSKLKSLCEQLKTMGAVITTIGIGDDVNERLLKSVARWGGGNYYRSDLDSVPQVMVKETARVTRELIQEGLFQPKVANNNAALAGFESWPALKGYLVTKPKPMASVLLSVGKDDPLLAMWRYGSGRVAVFTSDSGKRWLNPWVGGPDYNRFWGQIVRTVHRNQPDDGLRIQSFALGDRVSIIVEAMDPGGRLRLGRTLQGRLRDGSGKTFFLEETAPGRYEAEIPFKKRGYHLFEVRELPTGNWKTGGIWRSSGQEMVTTGPDMTSIANLATSSRIMRINSLQPPPPAWAWERVPLRTYLLFLVTLVFVFELGVRSLTLGQMQGVREAFTGWRSRLITQIEAARRRKEPQLSDTARSDDAAARRYLAEQMKKRLRGSEDILKK